MELLVDGLWERHVKPLMLRMGMDVLKQAWIILWDVYSSHRDRTLLDNLKKKYPNLIILFVPANCTPKLQPLDVGFNSSWKSLITGFACAWLAAGVAAQLTDGVTAAAVVLSTTKKQLVAPFCEWVANATRQMKGRQLECAKAWTKAGFDVAWDREQRAPLLEEAKKLLGEGVLFKALTQKRSKNGAVPITHLAGATLLCLFSVSSLSLLCLFTRLFSLR
jgi:hypothetical protein